MMIIERFFGKGRGAKTQPRGQDEPRRREAEEPRSNRALGVGADPIPPSPTMAATDAPASLARAGDGQGARTPPMPGREPSYEETSARAYEIWLLRGRPEGCERENWTEAERQLRLERGLT
jgi:hypothetical protein